jgi:hypothetical protein
MRAERAMPLAWDATTEKNTWNVPWASVHREEEACASGHLVESICTRAALA